MIGSWSKWLVEKSFLCIFNVNFLIGFVLFNFLLWLHEVQVNIYLNFMNSTAYLWYKIFSFVAWWAILFFSGSIVVFMSHKIAKVNNEASRNIVKVNDVRSDAVNN